VQFFIGELVINMVAHWFSDFVKVLPLFVLSLGQGLVSRFFSSLIFIFEYCRCATMRIFSHV